MRLTCACALLLVLTTGCATSAYPVRVYQENVAAIMRGEFAHDWSGSGAIRFTHDDGEKFSGEYTSVSQQIYRTSLTGIIPTSTAGVGALIPSSSTTSSNLHYGLASMAGDRGTSANCKYVAMLKSLVEGFSVVGACQDSKGRRYTMHMDSSGGAQFPEEGNQAQ